MDDVIKTILQTAGPIGALLIVSVWALGKIQKELSEVQEKRIADAQLSTAKLLELVKTQHENLAALAAAIDKNADATGELRMLVESLMSERGYNRLPLPPPRTSGRKPPP